MNLSKQMACLFGITLLASGCGGGGGGGATTGGGNDNTVTLSSLVEGIEVPSEISAVPADNSDQSNKATYKAGSFSAAIRSILAAATTSDLSTTSDYALAEPSVYVEERALEQFDIIEQVFGALAQTNYAKEENVNQGPYKAMIAWKEEQNGKDVKSLQTWTVESQMIVKTLPSDVTGNTTGDVNRLMAWIPETDRETGQEQLVKAEFLIYTAPDKSTDGSLINYGEWDMNVLMRASTTGVDTVPTGGPTQFFAASARIGAGGVSVLKVHDRFGETMDPDGPGGMDAIVLSEEMKGILYREGTSGYGQVSYPDWEACWRNDPSSGETANPCESGVPTNVAKYSYNANYLGVQQTLGSTADPVVYKDRSITGAIRLVHRYDLFYADADTGAGIAEGDNVSKHVNFGFPVSFEQTSTDGNSTTFNDFGFYGAWQGRHQLWVGGSYTATTDGSDGTLFTRQDVAPGDTAPTYRLKEFNGTFTMRALVEASLADIKNVAVETWLNKNYDMIYFDPDGASALPADWQYCAGWIDWMNFDPNATTPVPPTCRDKGNTDNNTNEIAFIPLHGADGVPGGDSDSELLAQLSISSNDRRQINMNSCNSSGACSEYLYLNTDPSNVTWTGAGFYPAEWGMDGLAAVSGGSILAAAEGNQMWVNISGSIFVAYDGDFSNGMTGWVQKELTGFDQQTWTPTFGTGDTSFTPERGNQYYMNANGQNYVVTRTDAGGTSAFEAGDYVAKSELQTTANPINTDSSASPSASVLPTGTAYLAAPWDAGVKYKLIEDPSLANYLLLEVFANESDPTTIGSIASKGVWGLVAYADSNTTPTDYTDDQPIASDGSLLTVDEWGWVDPALNSDKEPIQFNWEYADDQNPWGKQQFLQYANGANVGKLVILSDPIQLSQVGLYDNLGNSVDADGNVVAETDTAWKKVNVQYDGWLHGLPDMYHELQINGWEFTPDMAGKIRRLKEGQKVSDGTREYFIKPMETSLFLGIVNAFPQSPGQPDLTAADGVDLTTVPDYVHHEMDAAPTTAQDGTAIKVKYSEGQPIQ